MTVARHTRPPELEAATLEEIMERYVARFRDRAPDWEAFEDARHDGHRRAQHRFIGAGGSGKHDDPNAIPARAHTLSIIYLPPGQTSPAHTHEVEETFFVLEGLLDVFVEDEDGRRITSRLGPWDCICCPPGVIHGFENTSLEPVYFQVLLGKGQPGAVGYADEDLYRHREDHLRAS